MENASKALLIAAGVLIVILLIAMGMKIFNSTTGTADNIETTMNATEKATYNSKFTTYLGQNKSAAQAKALANVVIAHNATISDPSKKITLTIINVVCTTPEEITNTVSNLSGSGKIEVPTGGYNSDGLITKINIFVP